MYKVKLIGAAKKHLKHIDKRYLSKVTTLINLLSTNPFVGEKMSGEFKGCYRIKIPPIRIIYFPEFKHKIIWIRAIGHRGDVYK